MNISKELKARIERAFPCNEKVKAQLLAGDVTAIQNVGIASHKGISPEDVVEACENDQMDYLYKIAKRKLELQELYKELCDCFAESCVEEWQHEKMAAE